MKKKYYTYLLPSGEKGVVDNWKDCERKVSGVPGARFRGFSTREEAVAWLSQGARYESKARAVKKSRTDRRGAKLKPGIYFDAGTGRGMGLVEVNVTDEKGKSLLHEILPAKHISKFGTFVIIDRDATNNFGELLGLKFALEIAGKKDARNIFGDSQLVLKYWSQGKIKKNVFRKEVYDLVDEVKEMRKKFESRRGRLEYVSGDVNPADLGFH